MATSPSKDPQTFLANLRQSGLLSDDQWASLTDRLPQTDRAKVVARALVQQGILTKFQAEQILGGRTQGFVLGLTITLAIYIVLIVSMKQTMQPQLTNAG